MNKEELKLRTKQFALRTIKLVRSLPKDVPGKVLANQLMRSATSVGANYRSACRGRSKAEWRSKLGICLEEVDESAYWLELIMEDGMLPSESNPSGVRPTNFARFFLPLSIPEDARRNQRAKRHSSKC